MPNVCPGCGRILQDEEVAAAKQYKLRRPICIYCAVKCVVWMKDELIPMCESALEKLGGDVHE